MSFTEVHTDKSKSSARAKNAASNNNFWESLKRQQRRFDSYIRRDADNYIAMGFSPAAVARAYRELFNRDL